MEFLNQNGQLILAGFFALCLVGGFLFGLMRGWKRGLLRFGLILFCLIFALVLTPALYNAALTTDLGAVGLNGTVSDIAEETAGGIFGDSGNVSDFPKIFALVLQLPSVVVNLIVFVILFILLRILTWIIFGIIKIFVFGGERRKIKAHKQNPEVPKVKKRRLIGGGIGIAQGLIAALVIMIPLGAAANTLSTFTAELDQTTLSSSNSGINATINENWELLTSLPEIYKKSVPGAFYSGLGLDKLFYKPLTTVKVDGKSFTLEDISRLAGSGVNIMLKFSEVDARLAEDDSPENFKLVYADLFTYLDDAVEQLFSNGMVQIIFDDIGDAITDGKLSTDLFSDSFEGDLKLAVNEMFLSLASGDMAANLSNDIREVIAIFADLNDNGILYTVLGMSGGDDYLFDYANEETAKNLGKSLDRLLETNLLKTSKQYLFSYLIESMFSVNDEFGLDVSDIKFEYVKWESAMGTVFKALQLVSDMADENFDSSEMGDRVVVIIDTLNGQLTDGEDKSNLVGAFEGLIKSVIASLKLEGVDDEFLKDLDLDILANARQLGALIDLMNDSAKFADLAVRANSIDEGFIETIDLLEAHLATLDGATGDFKLLLDKVIGSIMGVPDVSGTIKTIRDSLEVFRIITQAKDAIGELPQSGQLTPELAEQLVELIRNDMILDLIESNMPSIGIDLGANIGLVEDTIVDFIKDVKTDGRISDEDKAIILDQYVKIGGLFNIAIDPSTILP